MASESPNSNRLYIPGSARAVIDRLSLRIGINEGRVVDVAVDLLEAKLARRGGLLEQSPAISIAHLGSMVEQLLIADESRLQNIQILSERLARAERLGAFASLNRLASA